MKCSDTTSAIASIYDGGTDDIVKCIVKVSIVDRVIFIHGA